MDVKLGYSQPGLQNTFSKSPFAPENNAPHEGLNVRALRLASEKIKSRMLERSKEGVGVRLTREAITRDDYPKLVELKVAGHSDRDIAKKLGASLEQVKLHSARAMRDYRDGKIRIQNGEAVEEARRIGKSNGNRFANDLNAPTGYSSAGASIAVEGKSSLSFHAAA